MKLTPTMIEKLLNQIVKPEFKVIDDFIINTNVSRPTSTSMVEGVRIDVILNIEEYKINIKEYSEIEEEIDTSIRNALKYFSVPFSIIEFYVIEGDEQKDLHH